MHRFFTSQTLQAGQRVHPELAVVHHGRALRLGQHSPVVLFNGDGYDYHGQWVWLAKQAATIELTEQMPNHNESPIAVHLGVGMSLGERMEYSIQKATELGVMSVTPLATQHSERKLKGDRAARKLGRWQQVAQSAAEQCGRACVPHIFPITTPEQWLAATPNNHLKLVLHPAPNAALNQFTPPTTISALIGPEGGLSDAELALALHEGFHPLALGQRILRTETAPVVLLSAVQQLWGWS